MIEARSDGLSSIRKVPTIKPVWRGRNKNMAQPAVGLIPVAGNTKFNVPRGIEQGVFPMTAQTQTTAEFQVQRAGLAGDNWRTVCRGPEAKAREIFDRQVRLYSVGRFRLVDSEGKVIEERKALPLFSRN